ncbi:MAG: L-glutamate gamma-semialdehyde dehydrogenase [Deltaproteobacteria bacterium]|nr:L-glutamate gamma-semialdehyde dehydrogenase [Deltaproteobacteria bacterium]
METLYADFKNEPYLDFSKDENRNKIQSALKKVKGSLGKNYSPIIDGKIVASADSGDGSAQSVNPAEPDMVIGSITEASENITEQAIQSCKKNFISWGTTPVSERAQILKKAAEIFRKQKSELSALEILECGKQWREADGDMCEAIDFLEFYAQEAVHLFELKQMGSEPGLRNTLYFKPRGVAAVISPWNFPIAIPVGMIAAALAVGNTVVFKPAEVATACGYKIYEILKEAGLPDGVLNFLPGQGRLIGNYLVRRPDVSLIAFTGSKEVGLAIIEEAGKTPKGQNHVKKVIAEMGGKNAIIIDSDADLDSAITGVLQAAFGYQGQKCSACSRVIVLDSVYDKFTSRLKEAALSIKVSPAEDPGSAVGAVINKGAFEKISQYIEIGKKEAQVLVQCEIPQGTTGYFVKPTIFCNVQPNHRIAQEEIFGPVLAVLKVKDFDEALKIANGTQFALTGALYSRSPKNIERAYKEFEVGNLYINTKCTGAMVARQPFGGFKLSGVGTKAGMKEYLLQFVEMKTVSENTQRQGFAPETI